MKSNMLLVALALGLVFQGFTQSPFDPEEALAELVETKGNTGVAAGYAINGEMGWSQAAGYACLEEQTAFTPTTLTRIASISKPFTAVAVMQLVERNLIELDTPIQAYLPAFPKKAKGTITVRHLLAHTSGISQYQGKKEVENTTHFASLQAAMEVFAGRPLLFTPGSEFFYTTYGYVVLGRIIEEVSGLSYGTYMQQHLFSVAGMAHTGIEAIDSSYKNKSCLYHRGKRKTKAGKQNDLSNRIPGGGFYSTLEDLVRFGNALLDEKLISAPTLQAMLTSQPVTYEGNLYGLGWYFYAPPPAEQRVIGHGGGQTECTSQLMIVPQTHTVVVVLSNTSGTYPDIAGFAGQLIGLSEAEKE